MAQLEGDTLIEKQQHYNKLVEAALSSHETLDHTLSGDDIENLLKIEVACKTKNVEFVLKTLKSEDAVYASCAIKNSKWLITDQQYSHLINPDYMYTKLAPEMISKSFHKLLSTVRVNLKDEHRVESFYDYIGERNRSSSFKWLPNCSIPFIETEVKKYIDDIPVHCLRRLIEKSLSIFEVYMKIPANSASEVIKHTAFLAKKDTKRYLDAIEPTVNVDYKFSPNATSVFMNNCPERIINNLEFYGESVHMPTFVKYLNAQQDLKTFLLKLAENTKLKWMFSYKYMQYFIKYMYNDFDFVRKFFIEKEAVDGVKFEKPSYIRIDSVVYFDDNRDDQYKYHWYGYQWYKYAPFEEALPDLKKIIDAESSPGTRNSILRVLVQCARKNMDHVHTVLKYYNDEHINEPFKFKYPFVNMFLSYTSSHEFNDETWDLLNKLFQSMEVYIESENNVQSCIKAILIRHIIQGEEVPNIVKQKFAFETLKEYRNKLNKQEHKDAVFNYLDDCLIAKHNDHKISSPSEFADAIDICKNHLNLWNDWGKDLKDFTFLIQQVKNLIAINHENSWSVDTKSLYKFNKAWQKVLFNESILLYPSEYVCLNALKHEPALLARNKTEVEAIMKNDTISLKYLINKIRVYYPESLANEWKTFYMTCLEQPEGHKALVIGLCTLLPQDQLTEFAEKYAPSENSSNEVDQITLSIQKQIAQNLWRARPLCPLDLILLYAKGDYLQYALPSFTYVLNQMSAYKTLEYLPKLLDSQALLQEMGIRHASNKLSFKDLKPIFTEIWNSTNKSSIRTVMFTSAHSRLCTEKDTANIKDVWELLSLFIDSLTTEESKDIYKKMGNVADIPITVKPQYYMKCFTFLKALPARANCEYVIYEMRYNSIDVMDSLDDNFVVNTLFSDIDEILATNKNDMYESAKIVGAYMLQCKDDETANNRYDNFFGPLLERNLPLWNKLNSDKYTVKENLTHILMSLVDCLKQYTLIKKKIIPVKCYESILLKLEASLPIEKEYRLITTWKLAVAFIKSIEEHKDMLPNVDSQTSDEEEEYRGLHMKMAVSFGKASIQLLKSDIEKFNPSICHLFAKSYKNFFINYLSSNLVTSLDALGYLKNMLELIDETEVFLVVCRLAKRYAVYGGKEEEKLKEIREILLSHPSEELKIFYYDMFRDATALQKEFE